MIGAGPRREAAGEEGHATECVDEPAAAIPEVRVEASYRALGLVATRRPVTRKRPPAIVTIRITRNRLIAFLLALAAYTIALVALRDDMLSLIVLSSVGIFATFWFMILRDGYARPSD